MPKNHFALNFDILSRFHKKTTAMRPPFPCPVPTWHNDTYAAISPKRAELSSAGKTVIITGAVSLAPHSTDIN